MMRMTFIGALCSEVVRLRRSPLVPLHLVLALVLGGGAGLYFATAAWNSMLGTDAFFQLLGAGVPLLGGIACGLALDAERDAGDYANILGAPSRRIAFSAKGVALLLLLAAAVLIAALVFFAILALANRPIPAIFAFLAAVGGIVFGSICLYAIFLAVALRFGRNASIGVGAIGLLVAMASMGGLANGLVTGSLSGLFGVAVAVFVPFSWPSRLASLLIEQAIAGAFVNAEQAGTVFASALGHIATVCLIATALLVGIALLAVNRFENKRHS